MTGARLASYRFGDHSELVAQSILSTLAFTTLVPRSEDVGHDFVCVLAERKDRMLHTGQSFTVQVKSNAKPLTYAKPYEVEWLKDQDVPLLIGVVTRVGLKLDLYSTWRRLDAFLGPDVPRRVRLVPNASGKIKFDKRSRTKIVPLGTPILSTSLADVVERDVADGFGSLLRAWVALDQRNIANVRAGVYWTVGPAEHQTNSPKFTSFLQGFYVNPKNMSQTLRLFARSAASLRIELEKRFVSPPAHEAWPRQLRALEEALHAFAPYVEENARGMLLAETRLKLPDRAERVNMIIKESGKATDG